MPSSTPDYSRIPQLSNEQKSLLLAALSSNQRNPTNATSSSFTKKLDGTYPSGINGSMTNSLKDSGLYNSPSRDTPTSEKNTGLVTFGDTFFPDYNDRKTSFDIDFSLKEDEFHDEYQTFGNDENESGEKRKNPDDDESDEEFDGKRRESDDKIAKKPGRKLITAEPTTKRKAQNRAAQRAFRERKEKHVKDLEQKVTDMEKVTDNTTQENGILRAQIERLQTELREYKKRLSFNGIGLGSSPPANGVASGYVAPNPWSNPLSDFQFDFSKFGDAPDSNTNRHVPTFASETSQASSNESGSNSSSSNSTGASSTQSLLENGSMSKVADIKPMDDFSWVMPGDLDLNSSVYANLINDVNYGSINFPSQLDLRSGGTMENTNTLANQRQQSRSTSLASNIHSPAASTAQQHSVSSCGTSPEPVPGYNSDQPKAASNADQVSSGNVYDETTSAQDTSTYDFTNVDWLSHQNGGQFDPVLFGDYREPQEAIVGDGDFTSGFFDTLGDVNTDPFDFGIATTTNNAATPNSNFSHTRTSPSVPAPVPWPKTTACDELLNYVERCANGETETENTKVSERDVVTAHKLWTELQTCPKYLSGEFDIDALCSELSAKATCSDTGFSIPKEYVEKALWRLAGVPNGSDRIAAEHIKESQREALRTASVGRKSSGH